MAGRSLDSDAGATGTLSGTTTVQYDDGDKIEAVWSVAKFRLKLLKVKQ